MKESNKGQKRSSLKKSCNFTQQDIIEIQIKNKRNSVNWASSIKSSGVDYKEIKTSFDNIVEEQEGDKKPKIKNLPNKFANARRESIKNEFTLAKQFLKENNIESVETEEEEFEEAKKNTIKNKEVGKTDNSSDSENSDQEVE